MIVTAAPSARHILACLDDGPASPSDLASKLGVSAAGMTSLLLMLAAEGKVRVASVERVGTYGAVADRLPR